MAYGNSNNTTATEVSIENVDMLLNQIYSLADVVANNLYVVANAIAGQQQIQTVPAPATPQPVDNSVMARLKNIQRILSSADSDAYRSKIVLGL